MLNTLTDQFKSLETQGYGVEHKGLSAGGFPLSFRSSLIDPGITSPRSIPKPWSIKGDNLLMQASAFNPLRWRANHRGEARVDLRGPKGERWLFDVRPFSIDLDARAKFSGNIKTMKAQINRAQIQAVIGTMPPIVGLDHGQIDISTQDRTLRHDISLENVFLDKDTLTKWQTAFGPKIDSIEAVILKPEDESRFIGQTWTINWNGNIFKGDFDLTPSETGVSGTLRADVEDLSLIIDRLVQAQMFLDPLASQLKLGVRLLPVNDNGKQEITFNFRDGYLMLFGQRLYKF